MYYIFLTKDEPFDFDLTPLCEKGSRRVLVTNEELYRVDKPQLDAFFTDVILTNDYSYENVEAIVDTLIAAHPFEDGHLLTCDEDFMMSVARLRAKHGMAGEDVDLVKRFTHKDQMKAYLQANAPHLDFPRFELFDARTFKRVNGNYLAHLEDYLHYPIFVKPINQSASNNASKVKNRDELRSWCVSHVSDKTVYEFDEFIEGDLYHCDSVIVNGRTESVFVSRYNSPCFEFMSGRMRASILLSFDSPEYDVLKNFSCEVLKGMDVPKNAVTHLEVFRTRDGRCIFLEMGLRPPGGSIPKLYDRCLGVNIQEAHFLMQMKRRPRLRPRQKNFGAICDFPLEGGVISARNPLPQLESKSEIIWYVEPGQRVEASRNIVERACNVMILHPDKDVVNRDIARLNAWQSCSYMPS